MILLVESVWIRPSLKSQRPRTVVTVGRPARSRPNFSSNALAEFVAFQFVEQVLERRTEADLIDRKTAGGRNLRIIGVDRRQAFRTDEPGQNQMLERLPHQRRRPECFKSQIVGGFWHCIALFLPAP